MRCEQFACRRWKRCSWSSRPTTRRFADARLERVRRQLEPLYCGGETRRDSVYNGLVAAMAAVEADDWMLVHDAARPCLPAKDLRQPDARDCEGDEVGGILALPVADTVKKVAKDEAGAQRVPAPRTARSSGSRRRRRCSAPGCSRRRCARAQGRADRRGRARSSSWGSSRALVAGSRENLKVTWPEDLAIAEGILDGGDA